MKTLFGAIVCVLVSPRSAYATRIAGPHNIVPDKLVECPEELVKPVFPVSIRTTRNRLNPVELYIDANFTMEHAFDDDAKVRLQIASWNSGGGWKENGYILNFKNPCSSYKKYAFKAYTAMKNSLFNSSNMPAGDCPWGPGSYMLSNLSSNTLHSDVQSLHYGKCRVDFILFREGAAIACVRGFADIVPKIPPAKGTN